MKIKLLTGCQKIVKKNKPVYVPLAAKGLHNFPSADVREMAQPQL
jgi:hypothetical protein